MEKYICYDAIKHDITCHDTKEDALKRLKKFIDNSLDNDGWIYRLEDYFITEIIYKIKERCEFFDNIKVKEIFCFLGGRVITIVLPGSFLGEPDYVASIFL